MKRNSPSRDAALRRPRASSGATSVAAPGSACSARYTGGFGRRARRRGVIDRIDIINRMSQACFVPEAQNRPAHRSFSAKVGRLARHVSVRLIRHMPRVLTGRRKTSLIHKSKNPLIQFLRDPPIHSKYMTSPGVNSKNWNSRIYVNDSPSRNRLPKPCLWHFAADDRCHRDDDKEEGAATGHTRVCKGQDGRENQMHNFLLV